MKTADANLEQQETTNIKHILTIMKKVTDSWETETTQAPTETTQQSTSTLEPSTQTTTQATTQQPSSINILKFMLDNNLIH